MGKPVIWNCQSRKTDRLFRKLRGRVLKNPGLSDFEG